METAQYILRIFATRINIVCSWGFHNVKVHEQGLEFKVQGFKFKGTVDVDYNSGNDLFEIKLRKGEKVVDSISGVYADQLVSIIDNHVEKVEKYAEAVKNYYSGSH